jgi:hypothetical protein
VSSPRTKGGGYTQGGEGVGVNIWEDARHWIGLLQYNLSTVWTYIALWNCQTANMSCSI